MATNLSVYVNVSAVDDTRLNQPANFVLMDLATDKLIFTKGSVSVADGQATPSNAQLNEAATIIQATDTEIAKVFLLDVSDVGIELKEIVLAGGGDNRYAICLAFDGATMSEPTLEAWDTNNHLTANLNVLGLGVPGNSMVKGVLTTAVTPGIGWVGTPIAGGVLPNVIELNAGAGSLVGATDLYVNVKIVIPGLYSTTFQETPILAVRYTFV